MVQRPPLEQYSPTFNVNFLEHPFHDPSQTMLQIEPSVRRQIVLPRLVDCHQDRSSIGIRRHPELVHIATRSSSRTVNHLYHPVAAIHDDPMTAREPLMLLSLEVAQMVLPFVFADLWRMCCLWPRLGRARPHQLPIVIVDVRARIEVSIGRQEDVSRREKFRSKDGELEDRSVEVGSLRGDGTCVSGSLLQRAFAKAGCGFGWRWLGVKLTDLN